MCGEQLRNNDTDTIFSRILANILKAPSKRLTATTGMNVFDLISGC